MRFPGTILLLVIFSIIIATSSFGAKVIYQYDSLNRLIQTSYPDGYVINYLYDSSGNRLSRAVKKTPSPVLPDVKINGLEGPILVKTGQNVQVSVKLEAGSGRNLASDWWVAAYSPWGWFYWNAISNSWLPGLEFSFQYPLLDIPSVSLLNVPGGLPPGVYTFYFAIDTKMDGALDGDNLFYDAAGITVEE